MKVFFSIIIPVYNRGSRINGAIESVLNQTYTNWELIVVDDGSTDDTKTQILKYANLDTRINYIYQKNSERSVARNNGIRISKGNWICFLDSDDTYHQKHLSFLITEITLLDKKLNTFLITHSTIYNDSGEILRESKIDEFEDKYETILLNSITPGQLCIPEKIIKKNFFDKNLRISEDTELLVRLCINNSFKITKNHTHNYILHENNSVNPAKFNAYAERLKTLKYIFSKNSDLKIKRTLKRKTLNDCYFGIHKFYSKQNQIYKARLTMLKSIIIYPKYRIKEKIYLLIFPKNN